MNDDQPERARPVDSGSFGFLFSHDDSGHRPTAESSDDQGRPHRKSDDEAGPGRPLEMRFSGDGEPSGRTAS